MPMNRYKKTTSARLLLSLALALACTASAWSQNTPADDKSTPTSKVERLNRAPVSKDILKVTLPRPFETTLPNGVHLMILEAHRFPLITVQFELDGARPMSPPASRPGLANATAALLTEGTKTRTSKQIAEQIDSLGASLSASSGFGSGSAVVAASGLTETFDQWFAITADVLLHPSFPADELAQYQSRAKSAILQQRSRPGFLANQKLNQALYGAYPAAVVSATPESIDSLTPAMLAGWHAKQYAPQDTILAISGDVHTQALIPKLRKWLAEWKRTKTAVKLTHGH